MHPHTFPVSIYHSGSEASGRGRWRGCLKAGAASTGGTTIQSRSGALLQCTAVTHHQLQICSLTTYWHRTALQLSHFPCQHTAPNHAAR
jgi:hypothetical protein